MLHRTPRTIAAALLIAAALIGIRVIPKAVAANRFCPPRGPCIVSLSPADDATGVALTTNLAITFTERIWPAPGGTVGIYRSSDNAVIETINVTGDRVTGAGTATMTIDPVTTLAANTNYYVLMREGSVVNAKGEPDNGIAGSNQWNFQTSPPPQATYRLSLRNTGPDPATGVVVSASVPRGLTFVSGMYPGQPNLNCSLQGTSVICPLDPSYALPVNAAIIDDPTDPRRANYTVRLTFSYTMCMQNLPAVTATIRSDVYDPNLGNNLSNTVTKVCASTRRPSVVALAGWEEGACGGRTSGRRRAGSTPAAALDRGRYDV